MNAEILCVGTELLLGDTINTNSSYIAKGLSEYAVNVYHHTVVGDNPQRLKTALNIALDRSDIVFMTGGLGPTYDDLTKETVAEYFSLEMEMHSESLANLKEFFKRYGKPMTDNNLKQAMMPKGAIVLKNPFGTAPGCIVEGKGKAVVLMPGPPREMMPMFDNEVRKYLESRSDSVLASRVINIYGVGESTIEDRLKDMMINATNPTIAPYAKTGEVILRVTAKASTKEEALKLTDPVVNEIVNIYPNNVYGFDLSSLQEGAVKCLKEKKITLSVAESCTGGGLGGRITEISGSSSVFCGGVISYSNEAKEKVLGVSSDTLKEHGAVSKETALEMAYGVKNLTGSEVAVSITGIAGPEGGTEQKPVGLVYVALVADDYEEVRELKLARGRVDDRELIRFNSQSNALEMIIKYCKK